jgi:hypothetical protein
MKFFVKKKKFHMIANKPEKFKFTKKLSDIVQIQKKKYLHVFDDKFVETRQAMLAMSILFCDVSSLMKDCVRR